MRTQITFIIAIMFYIVTPLLAAEHSHHNKDHDTNISLNHGKKWKTDLPLRQSMDQINMLVKESLPAIHIESFDNESYKKLGHAIKLQTDLIFKNCKLPVDADRQIHKILIILLDAESAFTGDTPVPDKHKAFVTVIHALELYGTYFEHENWSSPKP